MTSFHNFLRKALFFGVFSLLSSFAVAQDYYGDYAYDDTGYADDAYYTEDYAGCDPRYDEYCYEEDIYPDEDMEASFGTSNNQLLRVTEAKADAVYLTVRKVTYVLAGLGAIALVVMAAFGKFEWKWFFMLIGGLFILAGFQSLVNFLN
ncbi:MAG: TrbC/VirB2 family protein [Alphaproteobacteria bacterium]